MTLDGDVDVAMLAEELRIGLNDRLLIGRDVRLVVGKIDVFYILSEEILFRGRRRRSLRNRRRCHREPGGRFLSPSRTFRGQVVRGRVSGRDLLGATGLNCANTVNGDVSGV